jgi:hypothetical protein
MLSADEARQIAAAWRDQFVDQTSFETSWSRFFEMTGDPNRERLEAWLARDQQRDAARQTGLITEPLLPTRSRYELGDETSCAVCRGKRYVRRDLTIDHPDFGRAIPCPACNR